jgi:predicted nucleotidyltransferase
MVPADSPEWPDDAAEGQSGRRYGDQVDRTVSLVRAVLGNDLVGVYLFGSAVIGGLRPRSDIDLMAVSSRRLTIGEKRNVIEQMLMISGKPRSVELTVVVSSEIRPWHYPPRMDFQFGNWWRSEYDKGVVEPYRSNVNPDLASLIRLVLQANAAVIGPPPADVFDPVPRTDYIAGLVSTIDEWLEDLNETDLGIRNVVLALARIWCGIATDKIRPKDQAAEWALSRLPPKHRPILQRAKGGYLSESVEGWHELMPEVHKYSQHVISEIKKASHRQQKTVHKANRT